LLTLVTGILGVGAGQPACCADSPPPPLAPPLVVVIDDKPGPSLPDVQTQTVPPTPPQPGQNIAIVLNGDRQYITRWKVPFDVECFPDASLINIESSILDAAAGEKVFRIFGRFVDGEPALQWRKFTEKYVTIITAKEGAVGQVDCLFVVEGQTKPRKRVTLSVNGGTPIKPPPVVVDPLATRLQAAFSLDTGDNLKVNASKLAAIYRNAATTTVQDQSIKLVKDLYTITATAANDIVPLPILNGVREVIASELKLKLPTSPTAPLTPEVRAVAAEQYARMAKLLEALR
jgi:hypothetical protein